MRTTIEGRLAVLASRSLLRNRRDGRRERALAAARSLSVPLLDAASNDYLGWADAQAACVPHGRHGAGASRLVYGGGPEHDAVEKDFAEWVGHEDSLLFSSGYAANVGLLSALAQAGDVIVSDELNHASIIDGCRLSRGEVRVFPHLDLGRAREELERPCAGQRWLVLESTYSMDGDEAPLRELRDLADEYGAALVVDEAHALGVFGPGGAGLCADANVGADVLMGAFGKGVGLQGACVASSELACSLLWNRARSFVYSTAPSPQLAAELCQRFRQVREADDARARLLGVARRLRARLVQGGFQVNAAARGPIVPLHIGDAARAVAVADRVADSGVLVQAIRPPTVPAGTSRLRLTVKASFVDEDVERLVRALEEAR